MGRPSLSLVVLGVVGVAGLLVEGCSSRGGSGGAPLTPTPASSPSLYPAPGTSPIPTTSPTPTPSPPPTSTSTSTSSPEPTYVVFQLSGDITAESPTDPGLTTAVASIQASFPASPPGSGRYVGFCPSGYIPSLNLTPADLEGRINQALDTAEQTGLAVFFHFDDHSWWWRRTDLNLDPANVEWSSFPAHGATHGTPLPRSWIMDGALLTFPAPPPCFDSLALRQSDSTRLTDNVAGPIVARLAKWQQTGQTDLFAGIAVGNETHVEDWSQWTGQPFLTGTAITLNPPVPATMGPDDLVAEGYNALTLRGYTADSIAQLASSSGSTVQAVTAQLLDVVAHDWAEFRAKTLADAGLPRTKIYTHFASPVRASMLAQIQQALGGNPVPWTGTGNVPPPFSAAVNDSSRPGFTMVRDVLDLGDLTTKVAAARQGTSVSDQGWAASESYVTTGQPGLPQTQDQYEAYLGGMFGHGARVVNVYGWLPSGVYTVQPAHVSVIQEWLSGRTLPSTWTKD